MNALNNVDASQSFWIRLVSDSIWLFYWLWNLPVFLIAPKIKMYGRFSIVPTHAYY